LGAGVFGNAIINSNTVTGLHAGNVAFTNNAYSYAAIIPIAAANYASMSGVVREPCAEGGQEIGDIQSGDWVGYNNVNLSGVNSFVVRLAAAGSTGTIQIHLDGPAGALIGTCAIPITGGWQIYADAYCGISGVSGTHSVYLVFNGGRGNLANVEFFGFFSAPPILSHQLAVGNTYSLRSVANSKYVSVDNAHTNVLFAESTSVGPSEQFQIVDAGGGNVALLSPATNRYVCAENNGNAPLVANRTSVGSWETFTEFDAGGGNIGLRAMNNGKFVRVDAGGGNDLLAASTAIGTQESFTAGFVSGVAPAAPRSLTGASADSQLVLRWTAAVGATSYNLKRSATNGGPYGVIASNLPGLTYTDTGLANGTTYYYVVSALNPAGESTNSPQIDLVVGALSRGGWVASASSTESGGSPANALDGNPNTRWSTGVPQTSGQWFQVDMGSTNTFYGLVLDAASSSADYPRGYQVNVSNDGINWGSPIASGSGTSAITQIRFATQAARYIRITQTGSVSGLWWSIAELNVLGKMGTPPAAPTGLAAVPGDGRVALTWNPSSNASGYNVKWSLNSSGPYTVVATNLAAPGFTDTILTNGTIYYYAVSALNAAGESPNSGAVMVQPVSMTPPQLGFSGGGAQIQITWPQDHQGWVLQAQTNLPGAGLGTNWVRVPGSTVTNQVLFPTDPASGSIFFRLAYP
jgi:hypothetical protein